MQIISRIVTAVMEWLNAPGAITTTPPAGVDWADLPTYHPARD